MRIEEEYNAILFLKVNYDTGEASVAPVCDQEAFDDRTVLWKMDVLQDIIYDLTKMHEAEVQKMMAMCKEHNLKRTTRLTKRR